MHYIIFFCSEQLFLQYFLFFVFLVAFSFSFKQKDFLNIYLSIFVFAKYIFYYYIIKCRNYKVFTVLRFLIYVCYPTFPRTHFRVY